MNSIIKNFELETIKLRDLKEINNFRFMTTTDQANYCAELLHKYIKVISNDIIYYYNINSKLWDKINKNDYDNLIFDLFNNTSKKIKKILKKQESIDEPVEKAIKQLCLSFDQDTYINKIISRSFSKLTEPEFITVMNEDKEHLPIKNGLKINLKTLEQTERTKKDYFTYECPVSFVNETPNADKFFRQIQPKKENMELVRKILGYSLTGDMKARKFFIWYGFGSNGKSKIFKIMEKIIGCQYTQLDKSIFMKNKKSNGATPEIMELMGKRIGMYSEGDTSDNIEMNIGGIKQISGEDKIVGRPLYCPIVNFYPYIKIHMATNYTPSLDAQKATKDRLVYIFMDTNFTNKVNDKNDILIDTEFAEKVENEYLSEMFSWIVKGAQEYYKTCSIEMTEEFKRRTEIVLNTEDSIQNFMNTLVVKTENDKDHIKRSALFEKYMNFCQKNSQRCQPRSSLFNRIEQKGFQKTTLHGLDVYRRIQVKYLEDLTNDDEEQETSPLDNGIELKQEPEPDYKKLYFELLKQQNLQKVELPEEVIEEEEKNVPEYKFGKQKKEEVIIKVEEIENDIIDDDIDEIVKFVSSKTKQRKI